ncbi:MAG: hypothetical protein MJZ36_06790 [Bacteroidaceae bacterium]|nr:hypothetical protein [Bacteroidaceae bacterium]
MKRLVVALMAMCSMTATFAQDYDDSDPEVLTVDTLQFRKIDRNYIVPTTLRNNWYISAHLGAVQSWGSFTHNIGFFGKVNPAVGFSVGKQITPASHIRLQLSYTRNKGLINPGTDVVESVRGKKYGWNNANIAFEWLPDFTNLFSTYHEDRTFNILGVVGIGGNMSWGYSYKDLNELTPSMVGLSYSPDDKEWNRQTRYLVSIHLGLMATYKLSSRCSLALEGVEHFLDDTFDGNRGQAKHTWDGHLNLMLGLQYRLGKTDDLRRFMNVRNDATVYESRMREIAENRAKTKELLDNPNRQKKDVEVDQNCIYTLISFEPESVEVDRLQQTNIYTTAKVWEMGAKDGYIFITNSSSKDNQLFQDRAQAIKDVLIERYEVPASRIKFVADESKIASILAQSSKSYVVFIVNE